MTQDFVVHIVTKIVTNCRKCPNAALKESKFSSGFYGTDDLFWEGQVWEEQVDIPEWCPLRNENG